LLSVYSNDLPLSVDFVTESVPGLIADALYIIIIFIYMATIQPVYTLIYFVLFPLLIAMQAVVSAPIQKKAIMRSAEQQRFNSVVNDSLQNIPTVVAYSLEETMEKRYLDAYDKFFDASKSYLRSLLALVMSGMIASMLPFLFIYGISGYAVVMGHMSISEFVAFTAVSSLAANWIVMLSQQLQSVNVNAAGEEKLNQTISGEEENLSGDTSKTFSFSEDETAVEFSNVTFAYSGTDTGSNVLNNVSFKVKKGTRVALVGESGSGKSTLLKLLLSLYEPSEGKIYAFGQDIHSIPANVLRSWLAYVPQDSFMFPESIRENLCPRGTDISEEKLRRVCESAGIMDFITELPDGFDTVLSESAENISGGQRQRLAIARAYLQNAPIVLFDEATSALDAATEADVLRTFHKMTEGRTVLMVAHRSATINACDSIIRVEEGGVIVNV
jgi:ABC-type multidrug transport system fused ATPase/permease subunit